MRRIENESDRELVGALLRAIARYAGNGNEYPRVNRFANDVETLAEALFADMEAIRESKS